MLVSYSATLTVDFPELGAAARRASATVPMRGGGRTGTERPAASGREGENNGFVDFAICCAV